MFDLQEIEAIRRLKYRYFRCLDLKMWDEMKDCFVEDATSAYDSGKYSFAGRDAIIGFLMQYMDRSTFITVHHGHHPEIDITSPTTATGIWALQDIVIDLEHRTTLRGAAYYEDQYVKVNGQWKIKSTGYVRTYEEIESRAEPPKLQLTSNRFAK